MSKEISFQSSSLQFQASITKVEREKVYGWTVLKTYDSTNNECRLVTLLEDGKTVVPSGGFSIKILTAEGTEIARKDLVAVDTKGNKLPLVPSVFDQPVQLDDTKTLDDYLSMNVKSIYQLTGIADKATVLNALRQGKMFYFTFNYRADFEGDDAFLIPGDDEIFVVVGKINVFEMVGLDASAITAPTDDETEEDLDFSML